jgi:hypothetical protein
LAPPNQVTLPQPLNHLLKENPKWLWTEACTTAFQEVKQLLIQAPVLCHYDPALSMKLAGDASAYGMGGVISHVYPDGSELLHPQHYLKLNTIIARLRKKHYL